MFAARPQTVRQMRLSRVAAKPPHHTDEHARPLVPALVMKMVLDHLKEHGAGAEPVTFAALCGIVGGKNAPALQRALKSLEAEGRVTARLEGRVIAYRMAATEDLLKTIT